MKEQMRSTHSMTIFEALQWGNTFLKSASRPEDAPMLDAEILLAHALGVSKSWLFTHLHETVTAAQQEQYTALIRRRQKREPIAYLTGEKEFFGRSFLVTPFVLIPRPETELLVEQALTASQELPNPWFVDIGTGSGAIAVTLAAETPHAVIASDIDPAALRVARENAKRHGVSERIAFLSGTGWQPVHRLLQQPDIEQPRALIVCANLPYLSPDQTTQTAPDVHAFEPPQALSSGPDGLDAIFHLLSDIRTHRTSLPSTIRLFLELDPRQARTATKLAARLFPDGEISLLRDAANHERLLTILL